MLALARPSGTGGVCPRPVMKFVYLDILSRGFFDGRAGLTYCVLQSTYEHMIALNMQELQRHEKGLPT
jgi:hypothetical protein